MANINRVTITGNLTRDPELKSLPSGTAVCALSVAVNGRRKNGQTGQWEEEPNYFDVTVWGARARTAPSTSARGVRWRSTAGCAGASGPRPRDRTAQPSI